ncbi:MAG: HD domain-containing protein [Oscillospiraceae bacterium]|nr:HD domain-containing protein [Oscillospiraceae bacterium]
MKNIIKQLEAAGFEAYAVGGCVRDSLLSFTPPDYDIATSAAPDEIKEVFSDCKIVDIGAKHGTIAVITDDENCRKIEITTFRADGEYSDSRRPDSVTFVRDLKSDLARRDFTVNAMAYSEKTGLIDLFGGAEDLKNKLLKCVGEPEKRFSEDALRIMRALRFMSEHGFTCEAETEKALRKLKENLLKIAPERIMAELDKLLLGEFAEKIIIEYVDVLGVFIPEIKDCAGFDQRNNYHIYDVLTHIAKVVSAVPKERILRVAALFHDVAKPQCFILKDNLGHTRGHAAKSAEIAEETMRKLRYDNAAIKQVKLLIQNHDDKFKTDDVSVKKLLNRFGIETLEQLCILQKADDSAKADFVKEERKEQYLFIEKASEIIEKGECFSLEQLAVNGNDLLKSGFEGKEIGIQLQKLLEAVITGEAENKKEILLKRIG